MENPFINNNRSQVSLNQFFARIYGIVGIGVAVSALTSFLTINFFWEATQNFVNRAGFAMIILLFLPLLLVFPMQNAAMKNKPTALPMFVGFSVLMGFIMSFTIAAYTASDVTLAFVSTAGMFFGLSVYGRTTKRDLTGMGRAMMGMLIGLIIAGIINIFLRSPMVVFVSSIISVLVFSGLIAWDNQKIEQVYRQNNGNVNNGWAISMALSLYLDFVNLFLSLLRIFGFMGSSRD
ncbi:Bax inhibitor-1/YccA family protein [Lactococcus formosensis]|jgi:Integral membrane protein, interacts with FtsH|uniref:Bax inhibitor-1/YccA family protein n=1 Tax=Lactococcus formosensis TaxID=1281486 RepID=A0A9Q8Y2I2_9LACT|nr:Bax inhibitor-1/YccA family protein [Lactococcus formosensis]MCH1723113.1 Bax inhibitor-1/YccA family protein [Lactococcus formosensis]MCO7180717.1 Bax inhibitor-1/YccA family protein [Lactococcus formosensis]MDG6110655.1 Bax inhibitor-1/YccA family protein [Lactococcus formosensis]MDG6112838.1 Bax inhibitor-1/YccA family protein [Lactococcus formosensis]MDG6115152.1 Bax inhibitor-1/YccA family protein [Lactococcus formosensis]